MVYIVADKQTTEILSFAQNDGLTDYDGLTDCDGVPDYDGLPDYRPLNCKK